MKFICTIYKTELENLFPSQEAFAKPFSMKITSKNSWCKVDELNIYISICTRTDL